MREQENMEGARVYLRGEGGRGEMFFSLQCTWFTIHNFTIHTSHKTTITIEYWRLYRLYVSRIETKQR